MSDERGFLEHLNSSQTEPPKYPLSATDPIALGRDPGCDIVLAASEYPMVSRIHAEVRPILAPNNSIVWELCDRHSANGTYLNGEAVRECRLLQPGDRIVLGRDGPEFSFELALALPPATLEPTRLQTSFLPTGFAPMTVTFTQLFPILSTQGNLTRKIYLFPVAITVAFVVFLFAAVGHPVVFNRALGVYMAGVAYYFIYQLCGKPKPGWVSIAACGAMILLLLSPVLSGFIWLFREVLPGRLPAPGESLSFGELLVRMFFGAGLMEELLKAIPVFGALLIGRGLFAPWNTRVGVWEPLDGILLGAASAIGFTAIETLWQYVPSVVARSGAEAGLQLLIPRMLGSIAGHIAYSGYFGYAIGLSVLIPSKRWRTLGVGYLTASVLHALWNAVGSFNVGFLVGVGVLSYAFLGAAILKARSISPTRAQNFATRFR
ncbi:MAG: PrsW family glutamic-type intramembrane protease [Cyanobacteriota bacterium]|nr:PrsW family glutamic-type intramembrane protease [Cyanobacteriota bacterium]